MKQQQEDLTRLGIKEIASRVREQLKKEFPSLKFSVTKESYSMGCSLHISLMSSHFNIIKRFEDITENTLFYYENVSRYPREAIKEIQSKKYHQLNQFVCNEPYNPDRWNNGVFLTEKGHRIFKRVMEIINPYHYDHSDSMTDYFDTNFYIHLNIGQWDKDYSFKEDYPEGLK